MDLNLNHKQTARDVGNYFGKDIPTLKSIKISAEHTLFKK